MEMVRQRGGIGSFRGCWASRLGSEGRIHHSYKDLNKVREQSKSDRRSFWAEETVSEKALPCVRNTKGPGMVRAQRARRSVSRCGEELRGRPGHEGLYVG